ncbi:MAG: GT4 family glycosyltransferase PelF [Bacteroidota bacterium]
MPAPTTRPSVLLTTEGTYPFEGGGVTTWADVVIKGLPDVDFHLLAVTGSTALRLHKEMPPHVRAIQTVPLFGSAEPTEFTRHDEPFSTTVLRRARTTRGMVERRFVPLLERFLAALERPEAAGWAEAELIRDLNRYFVRLDHRATFRSEATWNAFRDTILAQEAAAGADGVETTLGDLVQALRWLYSFLLPITLPVPRTDVAHATLAGFAGLAGVISKLEYGTPFVVTDHGIYLRERYIAMSAASESCFLKRFLLRLVHLVSRVCYVVADQVSPVCNHNSRWELKMGVTPDRIRTIYNGIDTSAFQVPEAEPEGRRPTVVTAARVFPLKDIETLIRACDVTRRRVPDVHFVVFGANWVDEPYTARCEALIDELGVRDHFTFAGYHSNPSELYHEGDVFALSSISEGFPFSVIEAMACGRPVVATDVGGVKEALVGGVGIVVPPRGFEPLGDGLADLLLDDARRAELARLGRERVVQEFDVSQMLDAHRITYRHYAGLPTDGPLPPAMAEPASAGDGQASDAPAWIAAPASTRQRGERPSRRLAPGAEAETPEETFAQDATGVRDEAESPAEASGDADAPRALPEAA